MLIYSVSSQKLNEVSDFLYHLEKQKMIKASSQSG